MGNQPHRKTIVVSQLTAIQVQKENNAQTTGWGTMGCLLTVNEQLLGLTNYHVLYGDHTPGFVSSYLAGKLTVYLTVAKATFPVGKAAPVFDPLLDYALFYLDTPSLLGSPNWPLAHLATLGEPVVPIPGMKVCKTGAKTKLTHGVVDVAANRDGTGIIIRTDNALPSNPLCDYGDSGSLWVLNDGAATPKPVALHLGRGPKGKQWAKAVSFISLLTAIDLQLNSPL